MSPYYAPTPMLGAGDTKVLRGSQVWGRNRDITQMILTQRVEPGDRELVLWSQTAESDPGLYHLNM